MNTITELLNLEEVDTGDAKDIESVAKLLKTNAFFVA